MAMRVGLLTLFVEHPPLQEKKDGTILMYQVCIHTVLDYIGLVRV